MTPVVVALRGVSVAYGGRLALDDVDLHLRAGERVALVGPSGAGKSTLLRLCTGTVRPDSGEVEVLGQDISRLTGGPLAAVRRRVGTVHQRLPLVGQLRVVHHVNAGHLGRWSRWRALTSLVQPREVEVARGALASLRIADKLLMRTDRLSGGEQQRVALARVLVQDPDLVLADEPVSSLDPMRADEVMRRLCETVTGAGGLGRLLEQERAGFDYPAMTTTILALIAVCILVDALSIAVRTSLRG